MLAPAVSYGARRWLRLAQIAKPAATVYNNRRSHSLHKEDPDPPHNPIFVKYDLAIIGELSNCAFSPYFTAAREVGNMSTLPELKFHSRTVHLIDWPIYPPAEHLVDSVRAGTELHLVHADAVGKPAVIVGIQLEAGAVKSAFIPEDMFELPRAVAANETATKAEEMYISDFEAIRGAANLEKFWTYEGNLIRLPYDESLRYYISAAPLEAVQP